jgi:hypothetical protein
MIFSWLLSISVLKCDVSDIVKPIYDFFLNYTDTFIGADIHDQETKELFKESCFLIGEYYAK